MKIDVLNDEESRVKGAIGLYAEMCILHLKMGKVEWINQFLQAWEINRADLAPEGHNSQHRSKALVAKICQIPRVLYSSGGKEEQF